MSTDIGLKIHGKIVIQEIFLQKDLELMIPIVHLLRILRVDLQIILDSRYFINCFDRNCEERPIATANCITTAFEISDSVFCDLYPPRHKAGVHASLIFGNFTLEMNLFIIIE